MRTNNLKGGYYILLAVLILSCTTSKQLAYFQDLPENAAASVGTTPYEPLKLQVNDEVQIFISSSSPEATQFFNLAAAVPGPTNLSSPTTVTPTINSSIINLYRVSSAGRITLPVLGEVTAAGLTTEELKDSIASRIKQYLKDAVITVNLTNFKVTVIGEVNRPVVVPVNGQTINVLEAIGASGDLTVFGLRKNVRVIRKLPDGRTEIAVLDLNNSNVMRSPYFQLKQNDIIYIQPNKSKGILGTRSSIFVPIITGLVSVIAIILTRS